MAAFRSTYLELRKTNRRPALHLKEGSSQGTQQAASQVSRNDVIDLIRCLKALATDRWIMTIQNEMLSFNLNGRAD
jgi:hypothetical protein